MSTMGLLIVASVALLVGPVCLALGERSRVVRASADGFALVIITGVCFFVVLPHVITDLGFLGVGITVVGLVMSYLAHRFGTNANWSVTLVATALLVHVFVDGAILSLKNESKLLAWAVVAHRLPAGFALTLVAQAMPQPKRVAWGLALLLIVATVIGYLYGPALVASLPHEGAAVMEALVAGVLLHVAFVPHNAVGDDACEHHDHHGHDHHGHDHHGHDHHGHDHHPHYPNHGHAAHLHEPDDEGKTAYRKASDREWAAAGALFGALGLIGLSYLGHGALESSVPTFLETLGVLVLESAPALLLGYALAGLVPFLLTPARTTALGRGGSLMQSLRGVGFGLPLPVCSCGVLPLYESLIRRGAPPVAAMAFFVATPELGLDAALLSVPLLGSSLTVARVVAAFVVAVLVALLVGRYSNKTAALQESTESAPNKEPWAIRIREGLKFGFVEVFDHTMPWIALGLFIAALAEPMLSHDVIAMIPSALQVPLAALVGVPVYVCASGATPVAALAIHKGLSTGAAIAFLIAGPATNVTTFGVLARLHGRRVALFFGVTVTVLAIIAGWMVDAIGVTAAPVLDAHMKVDNHASWFGALCVAALALLVLASLFRQGPRGALRQILEPIHTH